MNVTLIDLLRDLSGRQRSFPDSVTIGHAIKALEASAPVKHGEWQIEGMNTYDLAYGCTGYEPRYRCSCCGMITESYLRTEEPIMPEDASFPDYCPNCGARMNVTDINVGNMDGMENMNE